MRRNSTLAIDAAIRRAAIERLGCADVSIVGYNAKFGGYYWNEDGERVDVASGYWFALAVKPRDGADWEQLCRRRTKRELLEFIEARATRERSGAAA